MLSIVKIFPENFPEISAIILILPRAKPIYWKALKSFHDSQVFYLDSSCPNYVLEFFSRIFESLKIYFRK